MDRSATAAFLTELLKSRSEPCHLVEFVFDDGTVRVTDAWKNIGWGNAATSFALSAGSYPYPAARIASFSRAATATYVDGGVLKYAAANEARYQDGLLLIEDAAENLCLQSNAFDLWSVGGTPVLAQNATGPDGVANSAWTITDNNASVSEAVYRARTLTAATHTEFIHVKKTSGAQSNYPLLFALTTTGNYMACCTIDTTNGIATVWSAYTGFTVVTSSALCEDYSAEFWRVSLTFLPTAASWRIQFTPTGTTNPTQSSGTQDVTVQGSAVIFGADLKLGSVASSYIPTTAAAVTRDADVCTIYDQNTYNANGHFMSFSGLRETFDMQIPTVTITLSAVDQSWIAIALTKDYIDRPVRIYKAFIDYVNGVVSDPLLIFDGRMDAMPISDDPDGGTCTITVSATNQWSDFERRPGRHTNNNEQQALFAGDMFFERAGQSNRQIKWGAA